MTKFLEILQEIKSLPSKWFSVAKDEREEEDWYEESMKNPPTEFSGPTGLSYYLSTPYTYNELKDLLGSKPTYETFTSYRNGGDKVSAEWAIRYGDPIKLLRIYDYKGDIAASEEPNEKIIWHVGGHPKVVQDFLDQFGIPYTSEYKVVYKNLTGEDLFWESLILEISEKVIKDKFEEYKDQVVNLEYDIVKYYVERFDQIKNGLKDRVQRGDTAILTLLPKYLKDQESLDKLFYLDVYRWKNFKDLEKLIDGGFSKSKAKKKEKEQVNSVSTDADLVYNKDGIEIYQGDAEHKCIKYGKDQTYSWCISRPNSSMYGSYRFSGSGSRMFYFVFDRNRSDKKLANGSFEDPYHAIVIHKFEDGSYGLSDATNRGDKRFKTYNELLNSDIPEDLKNALKDKEEIFVYKPPSPEEIELQAISGKQLTPDQFAALSYETKKQYVRTNASNYSKLPSSIFDLLDVDLKNEAINYNRKATYDELKSNLGLVKRYADYRFTRFPNEPLPYKFISFLKPDLQEQYFDKFEEDYLTFDEIKEYFNKDILDKYIEKQINNFDFLPKEAVQYMTPEQKKIYNVYSKSFSDIDYQNTGKGGNENDRSAPSRYVRIHPINTKSFTKLSKEEKEEYLNLITQLANNKENQLKHFAVTLGIPTSFEKDGKIYFITPNSKDINPTYSIVDSEGNVIKDDVKDFRFSWNDRAVPRSNELGTYKGSESFYLKPDVDYTDIIINGKVDNITEVKSKLTFEKLFERR